MTVPDESYIIHFFGAQIRRIEIEKGSRTIIHSYQIIIVFMLDYYRHKALTDNRKIIFSNENDTIMQAAEYLKAYAIDTLLVSFLFCFSGYYNGCGKTSFVMIQGLVGAFGIRIPVSWLTSKIKPVSMFLIGLVSPCSTIVQIILCFIVLFIMMRKEKIRRNKSENISL